MGRKTDCYDLSQQICHEHITICVVEGKKCLHLSGVSHKSIKALLFMLFELTCFILDTTL
jgi:hypothetical protein